jgi:hypothetical protein
MLKILKNPNMDSYNSQRFDINKLILKINPIRILKK